MIKFEISSNVVELEPGNQAKVVLTVTNLSSVIDYFGITVEPVNSPETLGLNPFWMTVTPVNFSLRPSNPARPGETALPGGDSQQKIDISLDLPEQVVAATYAGLIHVFARSGPDNSVSVPFNIVVSEVEKQTLEMEPVEQVSRKGTEIFKLTVSNLGNTWHLYPVYAEDPNDEVQLDINPPEVTLQPSEQTTLTLKVRPRRRNWAGPERKYEFDVRMEGFAEAVRGSLVQRCAIPPLFWFSRKWKLFVTILVLMFLITAGVILYMFPSLLNPPRPAVCGPVSLRGVNVTSNDFNTSIYVTSRAGTEPLIKVATESADIMPGVFANLVSVSPDGRRLAYVTANNMSLEGAKITLYNLSDNKQISSVVVPVAGGLMWPTAPVWSADGEQLIFMMRKPGSGGAGASPATTRPPVLPAGTTAPGAAAVPPTATPEPATTPGAQVSPTALEMWILKALPGDLPKKLAAPAKLDANLFYGDKTSVVCWTQDNQSVLVMPRPSVQEQASGVVPARVKVNLDGTTQLLDQAIAPRLPTIPNLPTIGAPTIRAPRVGSLDNISLVQTQVESGGRFGQMSVPLKAQEQAVPRSISAQAQAATSCVLGKMYSQNDPQWFDKLLVEAGGAEKIEKIGDHGCSITAAAMLLNYYGDDTNPARLTSCLGNLSSPLDQAGWIAMGQQCGNFRLANGIRGDFAWQELDQLLEKGPAIVGLLGGQTGTHFVIVTGGLKGDASSYTLVDPWDGTSYKTLEDFLSWGYRLRWLINYDGGGSPCGVGRASATTGPNGNPVNGAISILTSGASDGGLYKEPQPFEFEVLGPNSGVTAIAKVTGASAIPGDSNPRTLSGNRTVFDEEGYYNISIQANPLDKSAPVKRELFFTIDRTPPNIKHFVFPEAKNGKWNVAPVSVQLVALDTLSGVATIEYQINNSGRWLLYNSDTTQNLLTFRQNGTYEVRYRATNGAGLTSPEQTVTIVIELPAGATAAGPGGGGSRPSIATPPPPTRGTGAGGLGGALPTVTPVPTNTPRPPVRFTPTAVPPATTAAAVVSPTIAASLPVPTVGLTATPRPTGTPVPTTTAAATLTPLPSAILKVTNPNLVYQPGVTILNLEIGNTGTALLNYTIQAGDSVNYVKFSSFNGQIAPGAKVLITVELLTANLGLSDILTSFQIVSPAGTENGSITIKPQPLPQASFETPVISSTLGVTVPIKLAINIPPLGRTADHAVISATYKVCATCQPQQFLLNGLRPDVANQFSVIWNTDALVPQTGISLQGIICASSNESACQPITAATNLQIPMSVSFVTPVQNSVLSDVTTIEVTPNGRTQHVVFTALFNGFSTRLGTTNAASNWKFDWNTSSIIPSTPNNSAGTINPIVLEAKSCTAADELICTDPVQISGLTTRMQAAISFFNENNQPFILNPDPPVGVTSLPPTLTVVITPTANVSFVRMVATYRLNPSDPTSQVISTVLTLRATSTPTPWKGSWNVNIPSQTGVRLDLIACFTGDENICDGLNNGYSNLTVPLGPPSIIEAASTSLITGFIDNPYQTDLVAYVMDANRNLLDGVQVTFTSPNTASTSATASFNQTTFQRQAQVFTVQGKATAPTLKANSFSGLYEVYATIVQPVSNRVYTATFSLFNKQPGDEPIQIVSGNLQHAPLEEAYQSPLIVKLVKLQNNVLVPAPGVTTTFQVLNSGGSTPASATFPGTTTINLLSDASGLVSTAGFPLTANTQRGNFDVLVSAQGNFIPATFTLTNDPGRPKFIQIVDAANTNNQSQKIENQFAANLKVAVLDASNVPLDGVPVKFEAASTDLVNPAFASAIFPPGNAFSAIVTTTAVPTFGSGVATAPAISANKRISGFSVATATAYPVTATVQIPSVGGGLISTSFSLKNLPGDPKLIELVSSVSQSVAVSQTIGLPFQAQLKDNGGNLVPNGTVRFSATTGTPNNQSGQFTSGNPAFADVATGASGQPAQAGPFRANCGLGTFNVNVTVPAVPAVLTQTFQVTNIKGAAATIGAAPGSLTGQSQTVNQAFAGPFSVEVKDVCGNGLDNIPVTFKVPAYTEPNPSTASGTFGAGVVNSVVVNTSVTGVAAVPGYTANTRSSTSSGGVLTTYDLTASVITPSVTPFAFKLSNRAGTVSQIDVIAPVGPVSQVVALPYPQFTVQLFDVFSNTVPSRAVTFTAPIFTTAGLSDSTASATTGGAANGGPASVNSDDNGFGRITYTANKKGGSFQINVAAGTGAATFSLTNQAGGPAKVTLVEPASPVLITVTQVLAPNFKVLVQDQFDNPSPLQTVTFNATTGSGTSAGATGRFLGLVTPFPPTFDYVSATGTATTDTSGFATAPGFKAGTFAGLYTVTATSGGQTATFNVENLPGDAFDLTLTGATAQTIKVQQNLATYGVRVVDNQGNGIGNKTVVFEIQPSGRASFTALLGSDTASLATRTSSNTGGPSGRGGADAPATQAGCTTGDFNVKASVQGSAVSKTFTMTVITGDPARVELISPAIGTTHQTEVTSAFPQPFVIGVFDGCNAPVPSAAVTLTPIAGGRGQTLNPATAQTVTTDASGPTLGQKSVTLTANQISGLHTVNFKIGAGGTAATEKIINLENLPGTPNKVLFSVASTDLARRTVVVTNTLTPSTTLTVTDSFNNPIGNQSVSFATTVVNGTPSVTSPLGSVTTSNTPGANFGTATVPAITVGNKVGKLNVVATSTTASGTIFIDVLPGPIASVAIAPASQTAGQRQSAEVGSAFGLFTFTVEDAYNNAINGATVALTPPAGGPGVATATFSALALTGANGQTTSTLTAGQFAGNYQVGVNASKTGQGSAASQIFLGNTPGPLAQILFNPSSIGSTVQSAAVGTDFNGGAGIGVKAVDANGNARADSLNVFYTAGSTTAGLTSPAALASSPFSFVLNTSASDWVTTTKFTANSSTGAYTVTVGAPIPSTIKQDISLKNLAGAATQITGENLPATNYNQHLNGVFTTTLSVKILDGNNNPAEGRRVIFEAPASGARGTFAISNSRLFTATADVNGIATASSLTAIGQVGSYNVVAKLEDDGTKLVNFRMVNTLKVQAVAAAQQVRLIGSTSALNAFQVELRDFNNTLVTSAAGVDFSAGPYPGSNAYGRFDNNGGNGPALITVANSTGTVANDTSGGSTQKYYVARASDAGFVLGDYCVEATVNFGDFRSPPACFSVLNNVTLTNTGGNNQTLLVNGAASTNLSFRANDSGGNRITVPILYTAPAGKGTFTTAPATTGTGSDTNANFTSGASWGSYTVTATVNMSTTTRPAVNWSLTNDVNLALAPVADVPDNGNNQQGVFNKGAYAKPFIVKVSGFGGSAVSSMPVTFTAISGAGTFGPGTATTNTANTSAAGLGQNSVTFFGGTRGTQTVQAKVVIIPATLEKTVDFTIKNGVNIQATTTTSPSVPVSGTVNVQVKVTDGSGNPLTGENITWNVVDGTSQGRFGATAATAAGTSTANVTLATGLTSPAAGQTLFASPTTTGTFTVNVIANGVGNGVPETYTVTVT